MIETQRSEDVEAKVQRQTEEEKVRNIKESQKKLILKKEHNNKVAKYQISGVVEEFQYFFMNTDKKDPVEKLRENDIQRELKIEIQFKKYLQFKGN